VASWDRLDWVLSKLPSGEGSAHYRGLAELGAEVVHLLATTDEWDADLLHAIYDEAAYQGCLETGGDGYARIPDKFRASYEVASKHVDLAEEEGD
jgi:hypothetical protein